VTTIVRRGGGWAMLAALAVWGLGARAQEPFDIQARYAKSEHMIPMRDGVKLFTIVYAPRDGSERYPFLLHRTPYGSGPYGPGSYRNSLGPSAAFAREGYIFVYQDVRGQFRSEGDFVVMRPIRPDKGPRDTDESTDVYDTIEWLLKNVPHNNGRAGQWGISYPGSQTVWGMIEAHPALRASSPQAPAIDMFLGDDFHHNGAFRLMYTFSWLSGSARTRTGPSETRQGPFDYGTPDGYRFFLRAGGVASINEKYFRGAVPTWNEYMQHTDYDEYWQRQNPVRYLKNVRHAVLTVAGWFDAEDFYGPLETYHSVEKLNSKNTSTIVIGPWLHGGWASMPGDALGEIRFGSRTGEYFREKVELPFFNHYLKDREDPRLPEALVFETGANEWRRFDSWPPPRAEAREIYFSGGGGLTFQPPRDSGVAADSFTSDPAKPVPFSAETRTTQGHLWMVEDRGVALGLHDRHGRGLGLQAHRRVSWERLRQLAQPARRPNGGLPDARRRRGFPQQVPQQLLETRAAPAGTADPDRVQPARSLPPFPQRAPDHGPGAELLVPGHRSQSAEVHRHLPGHRVGFPGRHSHDPPLRALPFGCEAAGAEVERHAEPDRARARGTHSRAARGRSAARAFPPDR
jgi:putative CocE/NonD family hydrolase